MEVGRIEIPFISSNNDRMFRSNRRSGQGLQNSTRRRDSKGTNLRISFIIYAIQWQENRVYSIMREAQAVNLQEEFTGTPWSKRSQHDSIIGGITIVLEKGNDSQSSNHISLPRWGWFNGWLGWQHSQYNRGRNSGQGMAADKFPQYSWISYCNLALNSSPAQGW